jgi:cytidylate kinase
MIRSDASDNGSAEPTRPDSPPVVAIDGPAGAGKSTVARTVASRLNLLYLDTGAMYRALALKALATGTDLRDERALAHLLDASDITVAENPDKNPAVWLDGQDVTGQVRSPEVHASVSLVAGFRAVRERMVRRQRALAADGGVVMDGRDIGTYVLPDAPFKFFLTASLAARAARRQLELRERGFVVDLADLAEEILLRDRLDTTRAVAPLKQAPDARLIDTTDLSVDEVVDRILAVVQGRGV